MVREELVRVFFFIMGTACLLLGAIGVFIPLLPTTPFLLLSAALYLRSSTRMHRWLFENRFFGEYLRNYRDGRGIPMKTKLFTVALLWVTISYSLTFVVVPWAVRLILVAIAVAVSVHIVLIPTLRK
ncbi:MAG: YbaN family protein [Candidatus Bathyarchaeia archaeon]